MARPPMFKFLKISTLFLCELSAFFAAVLLTEGSRIWMGFEYTGPLWGIDIPLYYQTPQLYSWYCGSWGLVFLLISVSGIIGALRARKTIMLITMLLLLIGLLVFIGINARPALF